MTKDIINNKIIQSLFDRKSVRVFTEKLIPDEQKDLIIDSAIQAPSAGNQTQYTILDIEDQEIKDKLAILCDNQPFIAKAPWVLVFLADSRRWLDAYGAAGIKAREPGTGDLFLAIQDAVIAAQSTVVAAEALGIGSCYIGDILENKNQIEELLNLDTYTLPICMLVFGYPTEKQEQRQKPSRFHRKYILQKNKYKRQTNNQLEAMFAERNALDNFDFNKYITAFYKRKYSSEFAMEMNRSTEDYVKNYSKKSENKL